MDGDMQRAQSFGALLKHHRGRAGLTQEALAEAARLSVRGLSDLERGVRTPRASTVQFLATALGLSAEQRAAFEVAARRRAAGVGVDPGGTGMASADGVVPLLGRDHELALLERHLAGHGPPVLLLAGEPGIGKSRLLAEATRLAREAGLAVLQGGCDRRGGQGPYSPLLEALERHLQRQAPPQLRQALAGCAWLVRLLPELAAGPIEPLPAWTLTPEQERRLLFHAVARFLANVAGPGGSLLVLDDLQWAGADALDLLASLVRSASELPVRVVGAYRDSEVQPHEPLALLMADLARADLLRLHALTALSPGEAVCLLDALLAESEAAEDGLRGQVLQRAGGVPFFLISYARGLQAGAQPPAVPWDLRQSIRQRVALLPEQARAVLGLASVVGRQAAGAVLVAAATLAEGEVLAGLALACRAQLLEDAGMAGYRFAHDVIREVVEADVGTAQRAMLHRQVAMALERMPDTAAEVVAYHYAQTGELGQAARWLERAGDEARARFAHAAALAHYQAAKERLGSGRQAVRAASRLEEKLGEVQLITGAYPQAREAIARARQGEAGPVRRAELWRKEAESWKGGGEYARALACCAAADAQGEESQDGLPVLVQARIALTRAEVYWLQSDNAALEEEAQCAVALLDGQQAGKARDLALARATCHLGRVAFNRSRAAAAVAQLRCALSLYERHGDEEGAAECWIGLGDAAAALRELDDAERSFGHALHIYERIGDQHGLGKALAGLGIAAQSRGDLQASEDYLRRSLAMQEAIGDHLWAAWSWFFLGRVAYVRCDLATAEDRFRTALTIVERLGQAGGIGSCFRDFGRVAWVQGRLADAEACYRQAHAWEERATEWGHQAWTLIGLGGVLADVGDAAQAVRVYRRARRVASQVGDRWTESMAAAGQARVRARQGRSRAAAVVVDRACALLDERMFPHERLAVAEALLEIGRHAQAAGLAGETLARAEALRRPRERAQAHRILGCCALAGGDAGAAEGHCRAALAAVEGLGLVLEQARARLALAQALAQLANQPGVRDEIAACVAEARACFVRTGAAWDLEQADQFAAAWGVETRHVRQ
jgi:tetratricopeptide (TPR) repeat protein/transcriptional regulator with XRE-family HTH domain